MTTTGARTGAQHTVPVGYLPDGGQRVLVIASAGGAPTHPAWFHNLAAHPVVTVEDGLLAYEARATILVGEERDTLFARAVESDPGWGAYQVTAQRTLPVVALEAIPSGPRPLLPGAFLRSVHDAFRRELAMIRREVAASGPRIGAQLRINCLTACQGLRLHHSREDDGMFPYLGRTVRTSPRPWSDWSTSTRRSRCSLPSSKASSRPSTASPPHS
ncbi:nitroreductase/quinone reductase family protein [Oerskovia sp. M15]